jgi:hypothetical protein
MKSQIRLITAQGPAQLINVLAILTYQSKNETINNWEDHLVLGGFATDHSHARSRKILEVCMKISKYWNFKSIQYLDTQDLLFDGPFLGITQRLEHKLQLKDIQCVYASRNWQLFNEIVLEIYETADKICYGDGFGWLDIDDNRLQPNPYNPKGYKKFSKAYLFMPMEGDSRKQSFSLVDNIIQPPIEYLIDTINNISSIIPDLANYAKLVNKEIDQEITLITTSNFTEANYIKKIDKLNLLSACIKSMTQLQLGKILTYTIKLLGSLSFDEIYRGTKILIRQIRENRNLQTSKVEISMYFEQIIRLSNKNELILIKSHPRETYNQSFQLFEKLLEEGYRALVMDSSLNAFPIELFFKHFHFSKIISLNSSCSMTASFLSDGKSIIYPTIDIDIQRKYLKPVARLGTDLLISYE